MTDSPLPLLIERLGKLSGPDREVDDAISWNVSHPGVRRWSSHDAFGKLTETAALKYTESIDAAMPLVPDGKYWVVGFGKNRLDEPLGGAQIIDPISYETIAEGESTTPAIALCLASLRARLSLAQKEEAK